MTTFKISGKELQEFLNVIVLLENNILSEQVTDSDLNKIQKTLLNLKFIGEGSPVLSKIISVFQNNALNDALKMKKAQQSNPEEVEQFKKLVDNFSALIALSFDKSLNDSLRNAEPETSVKDALGNQFEQFQKIISAKISRYADVISSGANRIASRIQSVQIDPVKYMLPSGVATSIVNGVFSMPVEKYREGFSEASSFLSDMGLKTPTQNSSVPPPKTTKAYGDQNMQQQQQMGKTMPDMGTAKTLYQANDLHKDIANFWGTLSPQQRNALGGLKQILNKYNITA